MSQIVTINGTVNDLDVSPSLKVGSPPLWRTPEILNSRMVHGVTINGYDYPPAPSGSVLYLPGLPGYGDTIWDQTGNGHHGAITSATWRRLPSGVPVLSFDGGANLVNCGRGAPLDNMPAVTMEAWANPISEGGNANGFIFQKETAAFRGVSFQFIGVRRLRFIVDFVTTDLEVRSDINQYVFGQDVHLAATWDGSVTAANVHLYVNGVEVSGYALQTDGAGARIDDAGGDLFIGNHFFGTRGVHGTLGLPSIVTAVLTAKQLAGHVRQERGLFGV